MIGDKIRELRKEKQLTLKQLGKLIGVSESAVSLYETNKRYPNYEIVIKLSKIFNVTIDFLYGDEFSEAEKTDSFYIPPDLYANLKKIAKYENITIDKLVEIMLSEFVDDFESGKIDINDLKNL